MIRRTLAALGLALVTLLAVPAHAESCPAGSCPAVDTVVVTGSPAPLVDTGVLNRSSDDSTLPFVAVGTGLAVFGSTFIVILQRRRTAVVRSAPSVPAGRVVARDRRSMARVTAGR
jgi:hypothetical protein